MTRNEDLAWAAGFFDGEGYIGMAIGKYGVQFHVVAAQTEKSVMERFGQIVGGGNVYLQKNHRKSNWRPLWTWSTGKKTDAVHALKSLLPYLYTKKSQAHVLLNWLNFRRFSKQGRHVKSSWEKEITQWYNLHLKKLKKT